MTTLADLKEGQTAIVLDVVGDDQVAQRLMEMGLTDGEQVRLIGFAPMGDPIEFSVRGYRLTLRRTEAIRVTIVDSSATDSPPQ
ncbi:MAG: ferrous iron transport protein A [Pirellulaceae bacterium]|nr:ferrous iron transport protein A [Pirellulaceae bacterium]